MTDIAKILADELGIKTTQVEATIKLIDEGNTFYFQIQERSNRLFE